MLQHLRTALEEIPSPRSLRLHSASPLITSPQNCCCCTSTHWIITVIPYKDFHYWRLCQDTLASIRWTMYRASAFHLQHTRLEGKDVGGRTKAFFFLFLKLSKTKHQPHHQNTAMFSKVWVKPPEKQKQTVQRTVERITRSCLRSKH